MSQPSQVGEFDQFVDEILPICRKYISENSDPSIPVFNLIDKQALLEKFYNTGGHLPEDGISLNKLKNEIELILKYTMRTSKAKFLGKLYSGSDSISQFATLLLALINTNVHTFDAAPSLTVIEKIIINNLGQLFYGDNYINTRGGVVVPGGAYANYLGIRLARDIKFPSVVEYGYNYQQHGIPVIISSDQSHYCVESTGITMGIGKNNIIKIKTNLDATMNVYELRKTLKKMATEDGMVQKRPFILCATAGTTVFGAFDNFVELSKICKKYNLWFHIDACWGGSAVFCKENRYLNGLCAGMEYADSITFSAHKTISVGTLTAALLVKDEKLLIKSCAPTAKYLFHDIDAVYDNKKVMDISLKTLQCGRTGDGIRLYLSWLYHGKNGLGKRVLNGLNNAKYLKDMLLDKNNNNNFGLVIDNPHYCNVCYWYIPKHLKNIFIEWKYDYKYSTDYKHYKLLFHELDKYTKLLYKQLKHDGKTYTDFSSLPERGLPSFIRMVTHNYRLNKNGIISVINDVNNAINSINSKLISKL